MTYYLVKLFISAAIIVAVSEISKRSSFLGGLLASLPLVSFLGMIWLYWDTRDVEKIANLSTSIFWLVLPSLSLFIALPIFLRHKFSFAASLSFSTLIMFVCYGVMVFVLRRAGVSL
jgi:ABC-type xylose transport system permease subunit